jgi:hypothetical protein
VEPKRIIGKMEGRRGGKAQGVAEPPQKVVCFIFYVDLLDMVDSFPKASENSRIPFSVFSTMVRYCLFFELKTFS